MRHLKNHLLLYGILLLGFILRISAIFLDPFLHPWDERFHALVARNMMNNPFVPILRVNPITDNYDPFIWCCNHVWLHKQPLFMWQMALSMKVFGVSEWSMRLPSALMGTLLVLLIYRIVVIMTTNKRIALLTALMLACSNFHLQLIAGIHGMDHNDVAHGFYVLASIWALCEYKNSNKWYWVIWVGVFSGAAILNKWLTGLLVYLIWGLTILLTFKDKNNRNEQLAYFIISLLICCIVFIPWQVYILVRFPELAKYEYAFNGRHLTEAIEGHEGGIFFYFKYLKDLMGQYLYLLVPIGMVLSVRKIKKTKILNYAIIAALGFVFLFYSCIVKSKVDTYIFFVVPLALMYISLVIDAIITKANQLVDRKFIYPVVVLTVAYLSLNPKWFIDYLSPHNTERNNRIYNAHIYRNLSKELPEGVHVVMNMNSFEDIDVMFYNKGITAYHWTLPEEDFKDFERRKIPVAVFEAHGNYTLPEYVLQYPYLYIIKEKLMNF